MSDDIALQAFARELLASQSWIETANELLASATALEPSVEAWWESLRAWSKGKGIFLEHGFHFIYMMLVAFALENLCKAKLVETLTHEECEKVRHEGKLPQRVIGHDLMGLVRATAFVVDKEDEDLLRRLERASVWSGRYPVPRKYNDRDGAVFSDGKSYGTSWQGGKDVVRIKDLVQRLRQHLGAPATYRVRHDPT